MMSRATAALMDPSHVRHPRRGRRHPRRPLLVRWRQGLRQDASAVDLSEATTRFTGLAQDGRDLKDQYGIKTLIISHGPEESC